MKSSDEALNVWLLVSNSNGVICEGVPIDKFKYFPLVTILLIIFESFSEFFCLNNPNGILYILFFEEKISFNNIKKK